MIQDLLLEKQYDKLGIDVSGEELQDLVMGSSPHPYIAQLFTDPQTGIFNRQAFVVFMQNMESLDETSAEKLYYLFIENQIVREKKMEKYLNLIRQGLYATTLEASVKQKQEGITVDADYLVRNFTAVPDSSISYTDRDLRQYYRDHINNYKQDESRDIRFVYYEVVPSPADYEDAETWIQDVLEDFTVAEDIRQFVNLESDVPYDAYNYGNGELSDTLNDFMFSAEVGATFGPYFEEDAYKISRLAQINYLPDSVRARHILLQVTQANANTIFDEADSLVNMIREGIDFALLAMTNSADNTAQAGGELGWFREGQMVQAFNDSCFFGQTGDIKIVPSEYGLHIVEIQDQSRPVKKVQVGTLVKNVEPSEETDQDYYLLANEFAGINNTYDEFIAASEDEGFQGELQFATALGPMDKSVPGILSARQLVSWAYQAELHDVSNVLKIDDKYIIATVDRVKEKGFTPLADIRLEIENEVKKQKKAEILATQLSASEEAQGSIESMADRMGLEVQSATSINFISNAFGSSGMIEPALVATAVSLEEGRLSQPVIGANGVYVLKVTRVTGEEGAAEQNIEAARTYIEQELAALTNYSAYDALLDFAGVEDNRREFF
jgi:peptidyl-prolyl cis-trans isomerase D